MSLIVGIIVGAIAGIIAQKIIMEAEGELFELDTAPMNIMEEGNPLAEFLSPLGIPELLSDFQRIFHILSEDTE
jgi:hypothetical protein